MLRVHPWTSSRTVYRDLLSVYLPIGVISHSYREFADYQAGADASLSVNLVARLRFDEFSDDFAVHALRDRVVATPCKLSHHGRFFTAAVAAAADVLLHASTSSSSSSLQPGSACRTAANISNNTSSPSRAERLRSLYDDRAVFPATRIRFHSSSVRTQPVQNVPFPPPPQSLPPTPWTFYCAPPPVGCRRAKSRGITVAAMAVRTADGGRAPRNRRNRTRSRRYCVSIERTHSARPRARPAIIIIAHKIIAQPTSSRR